MKRRFMLSLMGLFAAMIVLTMNGTAQVEMPRFLKPERAARLIEEGRFDDARRELTDFRRAEPDNPWGLYYLALIEEDYRRALWMYGETARLAGSDSVLAADALFQRAEITYSQEHLSEAKDLYRAIIDSYPGTGASIDAWYRLGTISLAEGEPERAREEFAACLMGNPDGTRRLYACAGLMEAAVALQEWEEALDAAVEVLAEADDMSAMTPRVLEVMALSWEKLGNAENAERYTERLLSTYPYSYQAHAIRERVTDPLGDIGYAAVPNGTENGNGDNLPSAGGDLSALVPPSSAKFSVQAGAFTDRNNALKMYRSLQEARFDARVEMRTVQDIQYFVIRVGYFATRGAADAMADRVAGATGTKPNVVVLE